MKRVLPLILALLLLCGCANAQSEPAQTTVLPTTIPTTVPETTETNPVETEPPIIYADQIQDGSYEITVDSSSSMFRVVKCILTVEGSSMTADITMSGQGYGFVYMGTREEADADTEENFIPFVMTEDDMKTFTVPVEALNMELDCAAWSIKKEKWYDRTLVFESELLPVDALEG